MRRRVAIVCLVVLLPAVLYLGLLTRRIQQQSTLEEARAADLIVVLGAAEYNGRPSPVFKARLDHALTLYRRKLARYVMTTGGAGGDSQFTEGEVGRDYLVKHGVAAESIVVDDGSDTTVESIVTVSEVMRRMNLHSAILVSDGYHIFRAKRLLEHEGIQVYGSPRPYTPKGNWREAWLHVRQAFGYVLWRVGINI